MPEEFCQHLTSYRMLYEQAALAYGECLKLMDSLMAGQRNPASLDQLERTLNTWELQTRELREMFVRMSERGEILLPEEGRNEQPVCAHCGDQVPRLEFPEFQFQEDGAVLYRGQTIREPDPASTPEPELQPV